MDELFKQAAGEYLDALSENLPQPEDCPHTFSKCFEKQMGYLIAKTAHPVRTSMLRAAASFAAVLLLFGSVLAVDVNAREAFFGWVKEQSTSFSHFIFKGEYTEPDSVQFYPGWIPENYTLYDSYPIQNGQTFLYSNDSGDVLSFIYTLSPENLEVYIYTEACRQETLTVSGYEAQLYIPWDTTEASDLVWQDSHGTLFLVSGKCDKTTLIQFAEKILKK